MSERAVTHVVELAARVDPESAFDYLAFVGQVEINACSERGDSFE